MGCKLGQAFGCEGMDVNGNCTVYRDEGIALRMNQGGCVFREIRAPKIGIPELKGVKGRNPLKQAKMEARNKTAKA
jgi:hypothetical protein